MKGLLRKVGSRRRREDSVPRGDTSPEHSTPNEQRHSEQSSPRGQRPLSMTAYADQHAKSTSPSRRARSMSVSVQNAGPQTDKPVETRSTRLDRPASRELHLTMPEDHTPSNLSNDRAIANDYQTYLSALSPGSLPNEQEYMTLGGGSRLISEAGAAKHNEDIADRNIEQFGSGRGSSRHSSLGDSTDRFAPRNSFGRVKGGSVASVGKPSLGGEILRETSRDSTLDANPHKSNWGAPRAPRDETHINWRRRRSSHDSTDNNAPRASDYGPRHMSGQDITGLKTTNVDGAIDDSAVDWNGEMPEGYPSVEGIISLKNTEDTDYTIHYSPAVTHEVVKPMEHEIREEVIYREIHNHDVYHRVQPVYMTEILPARHWVPGPNGEGLVEVPAEQFPDSIGANQRWYIGERPQRITPAPQANAPLTSPKVIKDEKHMTPEGFERRETTILYPPTLEDLTGYGGPVMPVEFTHHPAEDEEALKREKTLDSVPEVPPMTLKELAEALPGVDEKEPIPEQAVPPRTSSVRHSRNGSAVKPWV